MFNFPHVQVDQIVMSSVHSGSSSRRSGQKKFVNNRGFSGNHMLLEMQTSAHSGFSMSVGHAKRQTPFQPMHPPPQPLCTCYVTIG